MLKREKERMRENGTERRERETNRNVVEKGESGRERGRERRDEKERDEKERDEKASSSKTKLSRSKYSLKVLNKYLLYI